MAEYIFNKITGKYNNLKTAKKNGLFQNPSNFELQSNTFINKKSGRSITKKTAEQLLKDKKINPSELLFNSKDLFFNKTTSKFVPKETKAKKSQYKRIADKVGADYRIIGYSKKVKPEIEFTEEEAFDKLKALLLNLYKYIVSTRNIPENAKFQLMAINENNKEDKIISTSFGNNFKLLWNNLKKKIEDLLEQYEGFEDIVVNRITVRFLNMSTNKFGASTLSSITTNSNDKYNVINPKTKINCLFTSWAISENPENYNKSTLSNISKQLKKYVNPTKKVLSDFETIQELVDYKKRKCIVVNSVFDTIQEFKPKVDNNKEAIVLQLVNNHIMACVPKSFIIEKKEYIDTNKPIVKRQENNFYNYKIAVWDIEASKDKNNKFVAYAVGFAFKNKYYSWWGSDCLIKFLDFLDTNFELLNGYTLYAHNGGKFDIPILLKDGLINYRKIVIDTDSVIDADNSFIGFGLRKGEYLIKMKDSLKLLPSSLDKLTKEFDVKHKKLTQSVNHELITLQNYNEYYFIINKYLKNDCLGLLEILNKFSKNVFDSTGINITECLTGATLSKKNYFKNYYNKKYNTPIYNLDKETDTFIRKSFVGGRNEAFKLGHIKGKIYYYDFTSLYPSTGRLPLPYDKPEEIEIKENTLLTYDLVSNNFGFYEVQVRTKDFNKLPLHGIKDNNGHLIFPHFKNWTTINLFSQEIKQGLDINEYKFIKGIKFQSKAFLNEFFTDAFNKKQIAKENNNVALAQCFKIIANSGFGFWGTRTDKEGIKTFYNDQSGLIPIANENKLIDIETYGDYTFVKCEKELKTKDFNVSIASAIASYARCILYKAINDIKAKGGEVYYTDTDSILTNINILEYPDLVKKYKSGSELGSLKNECSEFVKSNVSEEVFTKQEEIDGNIYYDELIILGCKFYGLKKTLFNGQIVENNKLNGYKQSENKLSFQELEDLTTGKTTEIKQKQNQFIKNSNLSIELKTIVKKFKPQYTKGTIKNNNIIPLLV